jgi:hypothetical protein
MPTPTKSLSKYSRGRQRADSSRLRFLYFTTNSGKGLLFPAYARISSMRKQFAVALLSFAIIVPFSFRRFSLAQCSQAPQLQAILVQTRTALAKVKWIHHRATALQHPHPRKHQWMHNFGELSAPDATVTVDGTTENVRIAKTPGLGLDQSIVQTLKTWKCRPAVGSDSKPILLLFRSNSNFT